MQKKKKKPAAGAVDPDAGEVESAADDERPAAMQAEGAEEGGEPAAKTASQIKREKQKAAAARKKAEADAVGNTTEAEQKEGAMRAAAAAISWSTDMRGIKAWMSFPAAEKGGMEQTWPPTVPVSKMFPSGNVPMGEQVAYIGDQQYRTTKAELRELERLQNIQYQELRTAAECHRQVRAHAAVPSALSGSFALPALRPPAHIRSDLRLCSSLWGAVAPRPSHSHLTSLGASAIVSSSNSAGRHEDSAISWIARSEHPILAAQPAPRALQCFPVVLFMKPCLLHCHWPAPFEDCRPCASR